MLVCVSVTSQTAQDAVSVVSGACLHLRVDCKQDNFYEKDTIMKLC